VSAANGTFLAQYDPRTFQHMARQAEDYYLYVYPDRGTQPYLMQSYRMRSIPAHVDVKLMPLYAHIKGRAVDSATGRPVAGATVVLMAPGAAVAASRTDAAGLFAFQAVPAFEGLHPGFSGSNAVPAPARDPRLPVLRPATYAVAATAAGYKSLQPVATPTRQFAAPLPLTSSAAGALHTWVEVRMVRGSARETVIAAGQAAAEVRGASGPVASLQGPHHGLPPTGHGHPLLPRPRPVPPPPAAAEHGQPALPMKERIAPRAPKRSTRPSAGSAAPIEYPHLDRTIQDGPDTEVVSVRVPGSRTPVEILYAREDYWNGGKKVKNPRPFTGLVITRMPKKSRNGIIVAKAPYRDGRRDGVAVAWHYTRSGKGYTKGRVKNNETYRNGVLHGPRTSNHANGTVHEIEHYVNGQLDGKAEYCYASGGLKSTETHRHGEKNGPLETFHETGGLCRQEMYSRGQLDDYALRYYENGLLNYHKSYARGGILHGESRTYEPTGKIREWTLYANGVLVEQKLFDDDGRLETHTLWRNESKTEERKYGPNGALLTLAQFDGNGACRFVKTYYPNGTLKSYEPYRKGGKHGLAITYYEDGAASSAATFTDGVLEGPVRQYDRQGRMVADENP